jgi:hypothetical protein
VINVLVINRKEINTEARGEGQMMTEAENGTVYVIMCVQVREC